MGARVPQVENLAERAPSSARWVLLVYSVPATPSRKRAAVWREVKRIGAHYLRDGVCVLPDVAPARMALEQLAERVAALGGQASVVSDALLPLATAQAVETALSAARRAEYAEGLAAVAALERHLEAEADHRPLGRVEVAGLAGDLARIDRWLAQIAARDYLQVGDPMAVADALGACRAALGRDAAAAAGAA